MDLLTCDAINSNLIAVTYDQYGSDLHSLHDIVGAYWIQGGCGEYDAFRDGPCFPSQGLLSTKDWSSVVEIEVLNNNYHPYYYYGSPSPTPRPHHHHPPASASSLLPSLFLIFCIFILVFSFYLIRFLFLLFFFFAFF